MMNDDFIMNGDPYDVAMMVMCILMEHFRDEGIPPDYDMIKDVCLQILEEDQRSYVTHECQCEHFKMLNNHKCYYCTYVRPYEQL